MRVYNLSKQPVDYRGHTIPPNGGSAEYPDLDKFLPARDKKLEQEKILSFGSLPSWWVQEQTGPTKGRIIEPEVIVVPEKTEVAPATPPALPVPLRSGWVERPIGKKKFKG